MQQLFQNIFGREESFAGEPEFREQVKNEFPYFGPAQFFALKNISPTDPSFNEQAAKTALYFNDLFYLNQQLCEPSKLTPKEAPPQPFLRDAFGTTINLSEGMPLAQSLTSNFESTLEASGPNLEPSPRDAHGTTLNFESAPDLSAEPLFSPLHASDYFASQGIKLSEDVPADDKLGRQLKSFTAWLKTMKKVHPENTPVEAAGEIAVQTLAEKSNIEEEVVTEAMAEAYLQQGKQGKAIDIYSKLSLQNPLKSAYFAAKIESLKQ